MLTPSKNNREEKYTQVSPAPALQVLVAGHPRGHTHKHTLMRLPISTLSNRYATRVLLLGAKVQWVRFPPTRTHTHKHTAVGRTLPVVM